MIASVTTASHGNELKRNSAGKDRAQTVDAPAVLRCQTFKLSGDEDGLGTRRYLCAATCGACCSDSVDSFEAGFARRAQTRPNTRCRAGWMSQMNRGGPAVFSAELGSTRRPWEHQARLTPWVTAGAMRTAPVGPGPCMSPSDLLARIVPLARAGHFPIRSTRHYRHLLPPVNSLARHP